MRWPAPPWRILLGGALIAACADPAPIGSDRGVAGPTSPDDPAEDGADGASDGADGEGDGADGSTDSGQDGTTPAFSGLTTFTFTRDGERVCDADLAWQGTDYAGDCADCAFQFAVGATAVDDRSPPGCDLLSHLAYTLVYPDPDVAMVLAYAPTLGDRSGVLLTGYGLPELGSPGPYWLGDLGSADDPGGTVSWDGAALSWSLTRAGVEVEERVTPLLRDCGGIIESDATMAFPAEEERAGELPCEGPDAGDSTHIDAWTMQTAGGPVAVTVEAPTPGASADLVLLLNDPEGCTVAVADDNFACAAAPLAGACPSLATELPAGEWTVVVAHRNACDGAAADYRLSVAGAAGPLVLDSDDLERTRRHPTVVTSAGRATVRGGAVADGR